MYPKKDELVDAIDSRWWNCCWLIRLPTWPVFLGHCVGVVFDVDIILHVFDVLLTLNWLLAPPCQVALHDLIATLHNLTLWPMVAIVGLYLIFKQRRPGMRPVTKRPHGCFYGMPSGDAMFATIVASLIFPRNRYFAILLILSIAASRVARGLHSVLQVFFGIVGGFLVVFLSRHYRATFQIVTWVFSFLSPFLTFFDRRLQGTCDPGYVYNLHSWVVMDLGILAFDILVCPLGGIECVTGTRIVVAWSLRIIFDWISVDFILKGVTFCLLTG
jgi:membrane-associated phospholipid phosphatase